MYVADKFRYARARAQFYRLDRQMHHKKLLFIKYVQGQDISMNKSSISKILSLKTGAYCWEADVNNAKLRNLFLIFKTPKLGSGACD